MNEKAIIDAVVSGNPDAFAELIQTHQSKVRFICLGFLCNPIEADDAAQDVFLKAFERLASFKGEAAFGTWISRIASNHCLDLIRARKRHHTDSLDALLEQKGDAIESFIREGSADHTLTSEDRELLGKIFGALDEEDRQILILRETQEMSYDEIASTLRCSLDAVKGRLKRARERLEQLGQRWLDTSPGPKRL